MGNTQNRDAGGRVLLADGGESLQAGLAKGLEDVGVSVSCASNGADVLTILAAERFDLLVAKISSPHLGGMELVRQARVVQPDLQVLVVTNSPDVDTAVEALRCRVLDYVQTPVDDGYLVQTVCDALRKGVARHMGVAGDPSAVQTLLLGRSEAMQGVRGQIEAIASHDITVLVQGETGTGKDLVARLLHERSQRAAGGELYKVNCPALPETLFEAEMFGHEQGAFTGATTRRLGRFELAHRGTIFLDEVGLLPLTMQAKLLEVLEYKTFFRVGGTSKVHADARLVSATNEPLEAMVERGEFRQDLFYRLRVCTIDLPPLRERTEDIPELLDFLLQKYAARYELPLREVPRDLVPELMRRPWPGNVRELEGLVAQYAVQNDPAVFMQAEDGAAPALEAQPGGDQGDMLASSEARIVKAMLEETGWNQRQAAKNLGISYSALRRRLRKYGIERPARRDPHPIAAHRFA